MTSPPSAAGHLEPYGAHIRLRPGSAPLEAQALLKDLLERVAAACVEAGATLIGHLKCVLRAEDGSLACNLISVRSGAVCLGDQPTKINSGEDAALDLAVLVYGLGAETIDSLVAEALDALLGPAAVDWSKTSPTQPQHP